MATPNVMQTAIDPHNGFASIGIMPGTAIWFLISSPRRA